MFDCEIGINSCLNIFQKIKSFSNLKLSTRHFMEISQLITLYIPNLKSINHEIRSGSGVVKFKTSLVEVVHNQLNPNQTGYDKQCDFIYNTFLQCLTHALGFNPFGYENERSGALVHDIKPIANMLNTVSSLSRNSFPWHTDAAFLSRELRPNSLSLMCIENHSPTGTHLASLSETLKLLSSEMIDALTQSDFIHVAPSTFKNKHTKVHGSILSKKNHGYEIRCATHNTQAVTEKAKKAFYELKKSLELNKKTHLWTSGDCLVFNNNCVLHSRDKFKGHRWLKRCYGSTHLSWREVLDI
tara:strand:+ start:96 stop:992 length:897 start_codon:yes stop_codon:yes gene_type:complete